MSLRMNLKRGAERSRASGSIVFCATKAPPLSKNRAVSITSQGIRINCAAQERPRISAPMARELWTWPNAITGYRFVAGPLCLLLLVYPFTGSIWLVLGLMVLAEISHALDGYVARSAQQVTKVGKILDPMADGLYRGSVFIAFLAVGWMPVWMLAIILLRDMAVSYLREFAEERQQTLGARDSGKWKAVAQ